MCDYRLSNKQNRLCNMAKVYGSSLFDMAVCTKSVRLLEMRLQNWTSCSVMSDKSEHKYSQQIFMSDQSVFAAQFASDVNAQ